MKRIIGGRRGGVGTTERPVAKTDIILKYLKKSIKKISFMII